MLAWWWPQQDNEDRRGQRGEEQSFWNILSYGMWELLPTMSWPLWTSTVPPAQFHQLFLNGVTTRLLTPCYACLARSCPDPSSKCCFHGITFWCNPVPTQECFSSPVYANTRFLFLQALYTKYLQLHIPLTTLSSICQGYPKQKQDFSIR